MEYAHGQRGVGKINRETKSWQSKCIYEPACELRDKANFFVVLIKKVAYLAGGRRCGHMLAGNG